MDAATVARAWKDALAVWDVSVSLSPPQPYAGKGSSDWKGNEPLAYIDLETRQVVVNFRLLEKIGAADSLTGVLAHEVGHHVRFPHSLALAASLQLLEKRLIPGLKQSLTNLFFDLLVNEHVGRTRAEELCRVYEGFVKQTPDTQPLFAFYLAIYEALWGKSPGSLVPAAMAKKMKKTYPGWRADARVFVQTFYSLPKIHLQFVYFCSRFIRYIPDPEKLVYVIPLAGDVPAPDEDAVDAAVRGFGSAEGDEALDEAEQRGFLEESGLTDTGKEEDPLASIDKITSHMPGHGAAAFKQALVSRHYRRLVDRYIIKPPPATTAPEPSLPTVTEEWEWGESPRTIDWTATLLARGPLGPVQPLRRDLEAEEPSPGAEAFPAVEIYLDTSGSMPDPSRALNAMTLAAQVLSASALRKQGIVRGIVYSSGKPRVSDWMYDEETARLFLLQYAGGGTDYPFSVLKASARDRSDVIRVIVSDSDFLWNVQRDGAMDTLRFGVDKSRLLVALLALPDDKQARKLLAPVLDSPRFRLATVKKLDDFGRAAADLAEALFGR
jgi:Peptidase family M48